jgi:uncharacterized protein DUF998
MEMNVRNKREPVSTRIKMLLVGGALAGPLFTLMWIIEGATRTGYNPLRHPVSSLALGDFGWMQIVNFIVAGLLTLAFAIGSWLTLRPQRGSTWGPLLIGVWAAGLLAAGIFVTDPVSGYPTGTPGLLLNRTTHGNLHDLFSLLGFLALTISCFVFASHFAAHRERGWMIYSILTGILFPIGIFLASMAFGQNESLVAFGGLIQRVTVTLGWTWLTLLAIHLLNRKDMNEGI